MELLPEQVTPRVFANWKKRWVSKPVHPLRPKIPFENLSEKQKHIVSLVKVHIAKSLVEQSCSPLNIICQGEAGVGKTELISHLKYVFDQEKCKTPGFDYVLASLTGAASFLIKGSTIHSSFLLPVFKSSKSRLRVQVDGEEDQYMTESTLEFKQREKLSNTRIICLDEMSLIGQLLLKELDSIMRKVNPINSEKPFGGASVILFGDIYQTFAVADTPLFYPSSRKNNPHLRSTYKIYKSFDKVFVLDKQYRQDGESDEQKRFREFLNRLKRRECNDSDLKYIRDRQKCKLTPEEQEQFEQGMHIFPLRKLVWEHNRKMLHSQYPENEIVVVKNGMHDLHIANSCPVILQKNICVAVGLSNGSNGFIRSVEYMHDSTKEGGEKDDQKNIHCIVVEFPGYTGGDTVCVNGMRGVPIFRQSDSEFNEATGQYQSSKRFPLELGYAITGHRSQGRNLSKASIFLDTQQFCVGLDYVMFSRCKRITDICILDAYIARDRILSKPKVNSPTSLQKYEEKRLLSLQCGLFEG